MRHTKHTGRRGGASRPPAQALTEAAIGVSVARDGADEDLAAPQRVDGHQEKGGHAKGKQAQRRLQVAASSKQKQGIMSRGREAVAAGLGASRGVAPQRVQTRGG